VAPQPRLFAAYHISARSASIGTAASRCPGADTAAGGAGPTSWMGANLDGVGGVFLWALLHNQGSQPSASRALTEWSSRAASLLYPQRQPEVRRALPVDVRRAMSVVPRAQLASPPVAPTGQWHTVKLLDGSVVQACYSGQMDNAAQLPGQGAFIGQEFSTGTGPNVTDWIWLQPAGAHFASWVDP